MTTYVSAHEQRTSVPVVALLASSTVSWTGNAMTWIAVPWFAYEITGSATQTGLVGFMTGLATVLAAFFGAPVVDRAGHKRASILADILSGASVLAIPLLHHSVGIGLSGLLALAFMGAFLDAPGSTARQAIFPDAVRQSGMSLVRANSVFETLIYGSETVGPILAGLAIAWIGASNILLFDAATFALSALIVALFVPSYAVGDAESRERTSYLRDVVFGLRYIWRQPLLRAMQIAALLANFIGAGLFTVVLLVYFERAYGSAAPLGAVIAAGGIGLVAGSVLFGAIGHRLPRRATYLVAFATFGAGQWLLAFGPQLWVILTLFLVRGFLSGPFNPIDATIFQEHTPRDLRGRVFGTRTALALALMPLGFVVAGASVDWVGVTWTLVLMGAAYAIATVWLFGNRALRGM